MPIHYGGLPCRIRELREIADDHNLLLIEDAAESMGASIHEKKAGSFGHAAMLSFCGNKVITTGEGGIILTDSKQVCEKLKLIRSHGRLETENYFASSKPMKYVTLGFNWRLSNIIAALGISQMRKLSKVIEMRRKNARYLTEQISKMQDIDPPTAPAGYFGIYQMYTIYVKGGKETRDLLQQHLADSGIGTKVYFRPVHLTHFYRKEFGYKGGELPETEELSEHVLSLPMYPTLAREEMDYVLDTIRGTMQTLLSH